MQILYAEKSLQCIRIDGVKVRHLLQQQGLAEKAIDLLRIHVELAPSEKQKKSMMAQGDGEKAWGLYCKPFDVYLFTNYRSVPMAPSLNKTLLHELRHHLKGGYQPGERKLAHKDRPSEIDAYAFAEQLADEQTLLTIPHEGISLTPLVDGLLQVLTIELVVCSLLSLRVLARWLR